MLFLREHLLFILQLHAATGSKTPSLFNFQSPLIPGVLEEPPGCFAPASPNHTPTCFTIHDWKPNKLLGRSGSLQPGQIPGLTLGSRDCEKLSLIPAQRAAVSPLIVSPARNVPSRHFLPLL